MQPQRNWGPFMLGGGLGAVGGLFLAQALLAWQEPDVARYREARDFVRDAFVRPVETDALMTSALRGLTDDLDAYSEYYDPLEAAKLERETSGRYYGLGVVIREPFEEGRILFPLAGSPALVGGVRPGDRFVRIDGQAFRGLDRAAFRRLVSTPEPRDVELVVEGLDRVERTLSVRTASVLEPSVRQECLLDPVRGVGYVAITSFSRETAEEFDGAVERLRAQGLRALVVDLRGNTGGVLIAAIEIARRFVPEGLIVSTEGRAEPVRHEAQRGRAIHTDLPLVVLIDGNSASASEVLASALQEHREGVLVGTPTYGKGMVQTMHHASDGSILKVTTSYYFTPSHQNLEHSADPTRPRGIQPDLLVEVSDAERQKIHARLSRASPPPECLESVRAWEDAEDIEIVPPPPDDAQVTAALELFSGTRPGPTPVGGPP